MKAKEEKGEMSAFERTRLENLKIESLDTTGTDMRKKVGASGRAN